MDDVNPLSEESISPTTEFQDGFYKDSNRASCSMVMIVLCRVTKFLCYFCANRWPRQVLARRSASCVIVLSRSKFLSGTISDLMSNGSRDDGVIPQECQT